MILFVATLFLACQNAQAPVPSSNQVSSPPERAKSGIGITFRFEALNISYRIPETWLKYDAGCEGDYQPVEVTISDQTSPETTHLSDDPADFLLSAFFRAEGSALRFRFEHLTLSVFAIPKAKVSFAGFSQELITARINETFERKTFIPDRPFRIMPDSLAMHRHG